jgi:hypothetical protein
MPRSPPVFRALLEVAHRAFWAFQLQHRLQDLPALSNRAGSEGGGSGPAVLQDSVGYPCTKRTRSRCRSLRSSWASATGWRWACRPARHGPSHRTLPQPDPRRGHLGRRQGDLTGNAPGVPPVGYRHLLVMSSVPVVHPELTLAENVFDFSDGTACSTATRTTCATTAPATITKASTFV